MSKVTFTEAATAAGVHFNTLRNWRKANKLTTAEKVVENGVEIWVVDLEEIEQLARQSRHKRLVNNKSTVDGLNVDLPPVDVPGPARAANNTPLTIRPELENFMALVERSQKPLLERIDNLTDRVENLARENGDLARQNEDLKERVKALEAAQAAPQPQPAPIPVQPVEITPIAVEPPQAAQEPEPFPIMHRDTLEPITTETKKGFWARLFGG